MIFGPFGKEECPNVAIYRKFVLQGCADYLSVFIFWIVFAPLCANKFGTVCLFRSGKAPESDPA